MSLIIREHGGVAKCLEMVHMFASFPSQLNIDFSSLRTQYQTNTRFTKKIYFHNRIYISILGNAVMTHVASPLLDMGRQGPPCCDVGGSQHCLLIIIFDF